MATATPVHRSRRVGVYWVEIPQGDELLATLTGTAHRRPDEKSPRLRGKPNAD